MKNKAPVHRTNQKEVFAWLSKMERLNWEQKGVPNVYPKASMLALVFGISHARAYWYLDRFNKFLKSTK